MRCPRMGYVTRIINGNCELKARGLCDRECELIAALRRIKEKRNIMIEDRSIK